MKRSFTSWLLLSLLATFITAHSFAMPAQIIVFRHAEKVNDDLPGLSARGEQRAELLPSLFASNPILNRYGTPVAIYAMVPKDDDGSQRSVLTVTPLAKQLRLTIEDQYRRGQYDKMVNEIVKNHRYDGKTVVICWQHDKIHDILKSFGMHHAPDWGKQYDRLWVVDFTKSDLVVQDLPMHLLSGDSN